MPNRLTGTTTRLTLAVAAIILLLATGASLVAGFVATPAHTEFDTGLAATVGTAFGTVLLAAFTAWLAVTTRSEVNLSIEEQRARDRPVIVVVPREVTTAMLDPTMQRTVPVLRVAIHNVGLAPALDLRLTAMTRDDRLEVGWARIAVVGLTSFDYEISLSSIEDSLGDFDVRAFDVDGAFTDRRTIDEGGREAITKLTDAGLQDEQAEAAKIARVRANVWLNPGTPTERVWNEHAVHLNIGNNGLGTAHNLTIDLVDDDGDSWGKTEIAELQGRGYGQLLDITLPLEHPRLRAKVRFYDGTNPAEQSADYIDLEIDPSPPTGGFARS